MKKLYAPYAALGTRLKNRLRTDPFFQAKFQIAVLYFVVGGAIILIADYFVDTAIRDSIYSIAVSETGNPVRDAFVEVQTLLWVSRLSKLVVYAVAVYFIAGFALRHIRQSMDRQSRFIATASHELRTPLTVMKNAEEVALRHPETLSREKAIQIIQTNLEEVNRLSDLVQFLLDFSKLNRQDVFLTKKVDLSEIASNALRLFLDEAVRAGVRLEFVADAPAIIQGNGAVLRQLIANLVKNALAHTPPGGAVSVIVAPEGTGARLLVSDTGSGISAKDKPHIFEPFYRGGKDKTAFPGMGLGLAMVQEIAKLHKASVAVQSEEGQGSQFSVIFYR